MVCFGFNRYLRRRIVSSCKTLRPNVLANTQNFEASNRFSFSHQTLNESPAVWSKEVIPDMFSIKVKIF